MRGLLLVFTLSAAARALGATGGSGRTSCSTSSPPRSCRAPAYGLLRRAGAEHGPALAGRVRRHGAAVGWGRRCTTAGRGGEFSVRDLVWDAAGAGSASVLLVADRQTVIAAVRERPMLGRPDRHDYIVVVSPTSFSERGR